MDSVCLALALYSCIVLASVDVVHHAYTTLFLIDAPKNREQHETFCTHVINLKGAAGCMPMVIKAMS